MSLEESPVRRVSVMDIGGSHVTAAKVDIAPGSALIAAQRRATLDPHASAEVLFAAIVETAASLSDFGATDAWAIAIPGPFDYAAGTGTFAGVEKFAALAGLSIRDRLATELHTEPADIRFLNDADSYGMGEWKAGAAVGKDRVICLTLGTGVGSCFLDDGVAIFTRDDIPEQAEVHLLSHAGAPLEDTVSTRAIARAYAAATGTPAPDVRRIAELAREGDERARIAFEDAMVALGQTLAPWVDSFRADCVVVGGAMTGSWDLLEEPFRRGLGARISDSILVAKSALMDDAPLVGAASWATR